MRLLESSIVGDTVGDALLDANGAYNGIAQGDPMNFRRSAIFCRRCVRESVLILAGAEATECCPVVVGDLLRLSASKASSSLLLTRSVCVTVVAEELTDVTDCDATAHCRCCLLRCSRSDKRSVLLLVDILGNELK